VAHWLCGCVAVWMLALPVHAGAHHPMFTGEVGMALQCRSITACHDVLMFQQPPAGADLVRMHAAGPGEQHKRNYNWQAAGIDPSKHAFGLQTRGGVKDGVKKCLAPGLDEGQQQVGAAAAAGTARLG
jgi:hypothetical protein